MLLMIFVIDIGSLSNTPHWLHHAAAEEDRMGLADIVFPCFLFIIGLSIPHSVRARLGRGKRPEEVLLHILARAASLIIMGLFVVNLDSMQSESVAIGKEYWQLLMVIAVLMIWNDYQSNVVRGVIPKRAVQALGWLLLGFLAFIYKGPSGSWMQIHWWGILGLLGWSYGACAAAYLFIGDRLIALGSVSLVFLALNANEFLAWVNFDLIISASNYFSVMVGVFCSVLYLSLSKDRSIALAMSLLLLLAMALLSFGLLTRPEWAISKIRATPSWSAVCAGISIVLFLFLVFIADIRKLSAWAKPIAAGGYAALTCYFALYFFYSVMHIVGLRWPDMLLTGSYGLLKSACVAVFVIQLTAWARKWNMRLNI